ncbi:DUF7537 family lipoprotein [Haloarcula salinisoli]|uniref:Uncharacterized protein n=1 Tax=Haloarcula salinisoli TaxID=2487746 RepID=A0A8J7YEC1_9EURY|nr:hypothetical protein [Halomicroarcula salinisoli]MBX0304515.1 hypothetical protein [Halomicroarcula salinisoli]
MHQLTLRRGVLVVAVALLIAVAGCSGPSGGATPTANGTENATTTPAASMDTPTPAASTDTPTDQQTPTDGPDTEPDSDVEANGTGADLDGEELNNATRAAIEDAGSYTYQTTFRTASQSRRGQSRSRTNTTTQVDLEAEEGLRVSNYSSTGQQSSQTFSSTVYTDGNTSYQQRITSEGTNYSTQEGASTGFGGITPVNTSNFSQNLTFVTDGLVWETNGTTTLDGDTVTEYTLAGVEDEDAFIQRLRLRGTLTDISGTLYVDDDDVVRQTSLAYTVESQSGSLSAQSRLTLSDIGSTTVEEPEWTSEAEDADSS